MLRAYLGAALGDITQADAHFLLDECRPIPGIQWMHLQGRDMDEEARAGEGLLLLMIAQHVADVLAEVAFDAFTELLDAIDLVLVHAPGAIRLRLSRLEGGDCPFH